MTRLSVMFALAFVGLIALSMDIWNWNNGGPDLYGMPSWVLWDIFVVILTGIYYALFSRYFWRDE